MFHLYVRLPVFVYTAINNVAAKVLRNIKAIFGDGCPNPDQDLTIRRTVLTPMYKMPISRTLMQMCQENKIPDPHSFFTGNILLHF